MERMTEPSRFVGLDVHARSISIAVAESGRNAPRYLKTIANDAEPLRGVERAGERLLAPDLVRRVDWIPCTLRHGRHVE